jgi:L-alanine-DL-glutamate epimerase-like enolase superfamily enzyme
MKLSIHTFDLPLRHPFTISRETITVQPTVIVQLSQDGCDGYGEATANRYYGFTTENICAALENARTEIESCRWDDPAAFWQHLQPQLADHPFAHCALDQAAHDLWGKLRGAPVYELWGLDCDHNPLSDYTIGIDELDVMIDKLNEFPDWSLYKIKLGTARDLEIVHALRQHTSATFRVDANCGWTADETIRNSRALQQLGVEFIEQPLPANQWAEMQRVHAESALPIMADESCITESDVERCAGHFHGINIKLSKCGGMTPARRMIDHARSLGLQVMVGCMTESTVGISAIAQLLPLLDYVDMDGAVLLAQDVATGARVERGRCVYAPGNGHGVELTPPPATLASQ